MKKDIKRGRKTGTVVYNSSGYHALKIIAGGAALGIALAAFVVAPGLIVLAKPLLKYLQDREGSQWKREQKKLREAIERLQKRRLVEFVERKGEIFIVITEKGKSLLKKFEIDSIEFPVSDDWDKKWRMVLFDIPEKFKTGRNALREKLTSLGFYKFQKSAFIYPYECRDEVDFIVRFFGVARYVQYLLCDDLGYNEAHVRNHFGLPLR